MIFFHHINTKMSKLEWPSRFMFHDMIRYSRFLYGSIRFSCINSVNFTRVDDESDCQFRKSTTHLIQSSWRSLKTTNIQINKRFFFRMIIHLKIKLESPNCFMFHNLIPCSRSDAGSRRWTARRCACRFDSRRERRRSASSHSRIR